MKWNVLLAVLLVSSLVSFVLLVILVWANRGGDRVSLLFLKAVVGPLALTLFLIGYDLVRPLETTDTTVPLTFFHGKDEPMANARLAIDDSLRPEPIGYAWMNSAYERWLEKRGKQAVTPDSIPYVDVVEAGLFDWMITQYPGHWQLEEQSFGGALGKTGRLSKRKPDAESRPVALSGPDLAKITANELLNPSAFGDDLKLGLPSNSQVSQVSGDNAIGNVDRELLLNTPYISFRIAFLRFPDPGIIPKKGSADPIAHALGTAEINATNIYVRFMVSPKRLTRWSGRTATELSWAQDVIQRFQRDFEWTVIK